MEIQVTKTTLTSRSGWFWLPVFLILIFERWKPADSAKNGEWVKGMSTRGGVSEHALINGMGTLDRDQLWAYADIEPNSSTRTRQRTGNMDTEITKN